MEVVVKALILLVFGAWFVLMAVLITAGKVGF